MTALRRRLIEGLTLRGYSERTQEAYVQAVACLAQHYSRAPDLLTDREVREYLLHLHLHTAKAASTLNVAVSGLRFFFRWVLRRPFGHIEHAMPRVERQKRRPRAYTREEVWRLLDHGCAKPKHRVFLMTVYGAGLRLNEACHLRPEHIDRSAGQIRVVQGKGRKDRYTVLPQRLLRELEGYWRMYRPKGWLFPGSTRRFLSEHRVTVVPSLAAARTALASGSFDLVLSDYDLDDGKGEEFVRECHAAHPRLPIIAASSHETGNAALVAAGASAVCSKMQFDRIQQVIAGLQYETGAR